MQENITERKQAEENLIISEQHFRSLFEQTASGVAIIDAYSGKFLKINQAFCEILGYTPEEMQGVEFKTLTHPDDVQISLEKMKSMLTGAIDKFSMEKRYIRKDGSEVWVDLSSASMWKPGDPPTSYITIVQDITPRKKIEQALHESEERYRFIDEASQDLIYSYDRQSRFTHANSSMCKLIGLPLEQIVGKTHEELGFPQEQCDEWARLHRQVYATNSTVVSETITPIQGGEPLYFEVILNPIHDDAGAIIGIAGTTRDINVRKRAEAQIREQLNELKRWQNITLGREDRIMELKREVNKLLAEAGKPPHYASVAEAKLD
jgi:PAS domain S-box-containing protein